MSEPFDYGHFDIVLADYLRSTFRQSKPTTDAIELILQK